MYLQQEMRIPFTLAIIGGGFCGTALAAHLLRRGHTGVRVIVVDRGPSAGRGRGVAYGTQFNGHLLNVQAGNMSMFSDQPEHFLRWAQRNYEPAVDSGSFLPRRIYGQYVEASLREIERTSEARLQWLNDEAIMLQCGSRGAEILLRSGERIVADKVVLALGNLPPSDPSLRGLTGSSKRYVSYPWSSKATEGVEQEDEILLLGSGLTSVDMALALRAREFKGTIHILSRRGLLPQPHRSVAPWKLFWDETSPRTARGLVRLIREQARLAEAAGSDWRAVIDALRPVTSKIWHFLPEVEQRRFLRHVRVHWEVRRHRLAPEVARIFGQQLITEKIQVHAGRVIAYRESGDSVEISYRERRTENVRHLRVARVINCTGPETDCRKLEDVLLTDLRSQGLIRPDPLFLGLDANEDGAAIDRQGRESRVLHVAGPARKAQLWESTAVPELRQQMQRLAEHLLASCPAPEELRNPGDPREMSPIASQQV